MTDLLPIPSDEVARVWPLVEGLINEASAFTGDRYEEGELKRDLKRGKKQLWLVVKDCKIVGIWVTKIFRNGTCQAELCAGENMKEWLHLRLDLEKWAKERGCPKAEVVGRPGWVKMLPDYKLKGVILEKVL